MDMDGSTASRGEWKAIAASVRGSSHDADGQPKQDAFAFERQNGRLIAAVCDGAGTAKFSDYGAQHLADALVSALRAFSCRSSGRRVVDDSAEIESIVVGAVRRARETVLMGIPDPDAQLAECASTLVGCVADATGVVFFHIGDGAGIAFRAEDMVTVGVSRPANGEFAETTYFFTIEDWQHHLRFTRVEAPQSCVALMTDGAMCFALAKTTDQVETRFMAPVTHYLADPAVDEVAGSAALEATLASTGASRISNDDKTLLWAGYLGSSCVAPGSCGSRESPDSELPGGQPQWPQRS